MRGLIVPIAVLAAPLAAHAQVATNTRLDAVVSLEQAPDPPLELTVLNQLDFGTVTIPNRLKQGTTCIYDLGDVNKVSVRETNSEQPTAGAVVSGCRYVIAPKTGRVQYKCITDRLLRMTVSFAPRQDPSVIAEARSTMTTNAAGGDTMDFVRNSAAPCDAKGAPGKETTRILYVGGTLYVKNSAAVALNTSIMLGTVTVEMIYA